MVSSFKVPHFLLTMLMRADYRKNSITGAGRPRFIDWLIDILRSEPKARGTVCLLHAQVLLEF